MTESWFHNWCNKVNGTFNFKIKFLSLCARIMKRRTMCVHSLYSSEWMWNVCEEWGRRIKKQKICIKLYALCVQEERGKKWANFYIFLYTRRQWWMLKMKCIKTCVYVMYKNHTNSISFPSSTFRKNFLKNFSYRKFKINFLLLFLPLQNLIANVIEKNLRCE